ncbi:hypothetical protein QUF55_08930 [Clostridiaceae bacterium HSG29]|nr:hypothetical protein [Clostridiaceae bacterium HSG29]
MILLKLFIIKSGLYFSSSFLVFAPVVIEIIFALICRAVVISKIVSPITYISSKSSPYSEVAFFNATSAIPYLEILSSPKPPVSKYFQTSIFSSLYLEPILSSPVINASL